MRDGAFYEGMFEKRLVTICQEIVDTCQLERDRSAGLFEYLIDAARLRRNVSEFAFFSDRTPLTRSPCPRAMGIAIAAGVRKVSELLDAGGARGSREPVRMPILIHHDATGRIESISIVQQAVKDLVAIGDSGPANPERIANAGLPLFRSFRNGR